MSKVFLLLFLFQVAQVLCRYLSQMNPQIENQLKSKISIAIDQNAYFEISGLAGPFERSRLIEDQDLVYAFVYSLSSLRPQKAKDLSKFIHRADLKLKTTQLPIRNFF
jgi:hypothetical protein